MKAKTVLFLVACATASAVPHKVDVRFESLALRNGTTLSQGTIKSYDPATGRVVLQAARAITSCQIELLPDDVAAQVVSLVPDAETDAAMTAKARRETNERAAQEIARKNREQQAEAAKARAAQAKSETPARPDDAVQTRAKRMAYEKAYRYYRYEFKPASGSIAIIGQGVQVDEPVAVAGWDRRYRVTGNVGLEFYDSRGRSFDRTTRAFEVLVGPDSNGNPVVLDFTAK
jgi:hypothetical protein